MITDNEFSTNVWLGEGDVGIGVAINEDGQACGIGFTQLKKNYEVGVDIDKNDWVDSAKSINILFTNQSGIESLMKGIERFVVKVVEQAKGEVDHEPKTTLKV